MYIYLGINLYSFTNSLIHLLFVESKSKFFSSYIYNIECLVIDLGDNDVNINFASSQQNCAAFSIFMLQPPLAPISSIHKDK